MCDVCGRTESALTSSTQTTVELHMGGGCGAVHDNDAQTGVTNRCYVCCCTECGQHCRHLATVSCIICQSRTHIPCARDVLTNQRMFTEWCETAASTRNKTCTDARAAGGGKVVSRNSSSKTNNNNTNDDNMASATRTGNAESMQLLSQIQRKPFFCSADCVMGVQLFINTQFSPGLSAAMERACARRWRVLVDGASRADWDARWAEASAGEATGPTDVPVSCASRHKRRRGARDALQPCCSTLSSSYLDNGNANKEEEAPDSGGHDSLAKAAVYPFESISDPLVRQEYRMAYVQLRYEMWCAYYAREMRTHAHPLFFLPAYVEMDDELFVHLNQLMCPSGQAQRLCQLDPQAHPIGSVIALPHERLWRNADRFHKGETNCFIAESMSAVLDDVAVVSVGGKRIHTSSASSAGGIVYHGGRAAMAAKDLWGGITAVVSANIHEAKRAAETAVEAASSSSLSTVVVNTEADENAPA